MATVIWTPAGDPNPVWRPNDHNEKDWGDVSNNQPTYWQNGDAAVFPMITAADTVRIDDANAGGVFVYASTITIEDGASYSFIGANSNTSDDLQILAAGTILQTGQGNGIPTTATISASIVSVSGAVLQTSGDGTLKIDGNAAVNTLSAGVGSAGAGTLEIDGNSTVSVSTATAVTGTLDVEGALNISPGGGLQVQDPALLQGAGTIALASACVLAYDSSQTSEFDGTISGAGEIDVDNYIGVLILAGSGSATLAAIQDVSAHLKSTIRSPLPAPGATGPKLTSMVICKAAARSRSPPVALDCESGGTFDGSITGAGKLEVGLSRHAGIFILGGQNTYSGGSDIEDGSVELQNYSCLARTPAF